MTLQWMGAMLVVAACGGIGFMMALHDKKEMNCLRQLQAAAEYMTCELNCNMTPLPTLLRRTSAQCNGVLQAYFNVLAEELENQIAPDVACCVDAALVRCADIPTKTREVLFQMGQTLGQFDLEGQIKGLESVCNTCEQHCKRMDINRPQRLRSYPTLGLCAGAVLAILLL